MSVHASQVWIYTQGDPTVMGQTVRGCPMTNLVMQKSKKGSNLRIMQKCIDILDKFCNNNPVPIIL